LKKIFLSFSFLFSLASLQAQKQTNIWYFGNKAGLDFNHVPPQVLKDGQTNSVEGCASVADNNGNLLFYTNGRVIINKQQQIMLNGGALQGDVSSTNNAVIVPFPGNDSMYYVFTTGAALQETHDFRYNIIDLKGDGGFGAVTSANNLIEDTVFEKIAGVRHCNNKDFWIVIHKWKTDEYHAYLLTASGLINTPVISHTGLVISGFENNEIGTLKFSAKGNELVAVHSFLNDGVELMDFDNTTGIITNPVVFHPNVVPRDPSFIGVYGAEFSPSGKLLYVSANNSAAVPSVVYQFDISSHNATTIMGTKQVISLTTPWYAGALQIGPDLKIYMAMWQDSSVSVIDDPDVAGIGCNFKYNSIYMGPKSGEPVQFGLPSFVQSYFDTTANPYDFSRSGNCADHNVSFTINRLSRIDSVKWDFGDGNTSRSLAPTNNYIAAGFYTVSLIVYKVDCSGLNDTIKRTIWITDKKDFLGPDTANCASIKLDLGIAKISGANYLWSTGSLSNQVSNVGPGLYWLEVQQNGCTIRDSVTISLKPPPPVNIGQDTSVCFTRGITLYSGIPFASAYLWNTGETTPSIYIKDTGEYRVTVTVNSCSGSDTVKVGWGDCDIYLPSAFTPNNDGLNDYFGVLKGFSSKRFLLEVFNKWGQPVFSSTDINQKWDGTYKKSKQPGGAYVWILYYTNSKNEHRSIKGTVMLLR
jgi:gliding motility-associated-like protein